MYITHPGGLWKSRFFHSLMTLSDWLHVRLWRILERYWGGGDLELFRSHSEV